MNEAALRTWTRSEFQRAIEAGIFRSDERLELLDGQIVRKMTQNAPHVSCIQFLASWLEGSLPEHCHLRLQFPIALSDRSQPEPDIAVVRGELRDYIRDHPSPDQVVLVIEVAQSSLADDERGKGPRYAEAGIPNYWIVDLEARRVFLYSLPGDRDYERMAVVHEQDTIAPPYAPGHEIPVRELLP